MSLFRGIHGVVGGWEGSHVHSIPSNMYTRVTARDLALPVKKYRILGKDIYPRDRFVIAEMVIAGGS